MLKCVVISDTHSKEKEIEWFRKQENLDKVNTVIHCGDFSHSEKTFWDFLKWYGALEIENKILICGNHDSVSYEMGYKKMKEVCAAYHIDYLQDSGIEIQGIKIWGSPMSNEYGDWPFMANDFELDQYWQKIPDDTNVLITHGPAYNVGDYVFQDISEPNVGSRTLAMRIRDLKCLSHHFFGHVHCDGGVHQQDNYTGYNASIMNFWFRPENEPWTFEIKGNK